MKAYYLILFAALLLCSCGNKNVREDLGKLDSIAPGAGNIYCVYKVTKRVETPNQGGFVVGDTLCVKCCLTGTNTWPKRSTICPEDISFEIDNGFGVFKYEASKAEEDCTNCPEGKNTYDCPD